MKLIVLIFFSTIFFAGNPQLVRPPSLLSKLREDVSNIEPYEIQSKKTTLLGEKQTKLKPQQLIETKNVEKPQLSDQNYSPIERIKYKNNKKHILDDLTIHIDTENAFIDYERNDTIAKQRQLVEIESMIIKPSKYKTNVIDFSLDNENESGESIENTNNTRRLLTDSHNLPIPQIDSETPIDNANSIQSDQLNQSNQSSPSNQPNQSIELKNVNDNREPLVTNDADNDKYDKNKRIKSEDESSSASNDKLEDKGCDTTSDNKISQQAGIPTNKPRITDLVKSRMLLFRHPRACYACNTLRDKSCWTPDRTTTVKYCNRTNHFCLTKFYQQGGTSRIIRNCGESCSSSSEVTSGEAYASCTICESDLCNSAGSLAIQSIVWFVIVAINIIPRVANIS